MRIAVLGASGRSGQAFVAAALDAGYEVTAGIRSRNPFSEDTKLNVIRCDGNSLEDVRALLQEVDVVVSLIGHVRKSPATVQTEAIKNILTAMQEQNISRLISLTGTGVRYPDDKITLIDRILNAGISIVDPKRIKDGINHARLIEKSNTDWTILRVLKLQNTKPAAFTLTAHGPTKIITSRKEVAQAIILLIRDDSHKKQAPIISKA